MTDTLQTVSPDQLGERAAPSDDLFALVFAPGGPIQKMAFRALLGKLVAADLTKATKALLDADLAHAADEVALVFNDPTAALNGWYRKTGASGAGAWTQFDTLSLATKAAAEAAATASEASRVRSGNALPFATWAALSAATGMVAGDRARVRAGDTGTHTDPVVGGTVKNAGDYTYSAAPAGWQRTADLDSQTAGDLVAAVSGIVTTIETDAFAMASVDKDGFLVELLANDFLQQSPNQSFLLDLISHSTIETDAFAYAMVDSGGFLIDAFIVDSTGTYWASSGKPILTLGSIPDVSASAPADGDTLSYDASTAKWKAKAPSTADVTPYMPAGDYLAAAVYGQSVFRGYDTTAISTGTFAGGGLLMFNGGMSGFDYSNSANLASLVAARESGVESAGRGVGEGFSQFFTSEAGYAFTADGVSLILSVAAEGGKSAAELSSGGTWFPRLQYMIDAIDTLARAGGKVPDVVHIVYCQGEADTVGSTSPALWYSQIETGIRQPFETYCQTKFGRKTKVRVIMTQVASHEYYGITDPAIARQVLAMCNTDPNYILAGAMYQYAYGAGSPAVGSHLLNATEMKWAAAMCGRALQRAARGVKHKWINPLRAWQDGPRTVAIEYDVPVGPLVIDTVSVTDPGQKGFNLYSGSTEVPISAVSIVGLGKRTVLLTTSSDIPAGSIRVDYAHKGGATNVNAGRTTGSRGCLRDSDPAVFDPSGINKPLFNWAPIHRVTVG